MNDARQFIFWGPNLPVRIYKRELYFGWVGREKPRCDICHGTALGHIVSSGMSSLIVAVRGRRLRSVISLNLMERIFRSRYREEGAPASITDLRICWSWGLHLII